MIDMTKSLGSPLASLVGVLGDEGQHEEGKRKGIDVRGAKRRGD